MRWAAWHSAMLCLKLSVVKIEDFAYGYKNLRDNRSGML